MIEAAFGFTTITQRVLLRIFLVAIALTVASWLVGRTDTNTCSFLILALPASAGTSSIFVSSGKYDVIMYLGDVISARSRSSPIAILGTSIMASNNPEPAIGPSDEVRGFPLQADSEILASEQPQASWPPIIDSSLLVR